MSPLQSLPAYRPKNNHYKNTALMRNTRFNFITSAFQATGICLLISLTACTDDIINSVNTSERQIVFDVNTSDSWSRSGNASDTLPVGSLSTVTLSAAGQQLYLIPEVSRTPVSVMTASTSSRATAVSKSTIASFGVYASTDDASATSYYMENVEITKANSWTPVKEYLWPGAGSLHINAYSPYCFEPSSADAGGITALPSSAPGEAPLLSYTVPNDVTSQTDLMWADPKDASSSPCRLTFNHAMSAIRFVTGAEMAACTVKSITISGVYTRGTLNIETGAWSDCGGMSDYTAELNTTLTPGSGQEYVSENTPITDSDHTFMLLPQSLGNDASVTLVVDNNGDSLVFNASLSGQTWVAGNTYTYRLTANPDLDRFVLTVDSPLTFNYTGGSLNYNVTSRHERMTNGVLTTEEVPWIAEFIDKDGNVISTPDWVTDMSLAGDGSAECVATTRMVEPDFVQMSEQTRRLRSRSAVGSAGAPYNLANSSGASSVENTANTYVINAPGTYSLPLVYGNAIKNGADNTAAYVPARSRQPFVNHLGNRIKHPYIYDNDGCSVGDAVLVWEGRLNLVRNVRLSDDGKNLVFDIPAASIRQGNAVVAVRSRDGEIMWSWQLWVTDYVPGTDLHSISYNGKSYSLMPCNLGNIVGGDETDFPSSEALVRFTQKPVDGSEGQSVVVRVEQSGKHVITPDCHSFYQWGRKDPMISGIKEWYYADHTEITAIDTKVIDDNSGSIGEEYERDLIKSPQTFRILVMSGNPTFTYTTNWNLGTAAKSVKTVYDPCPVGFMVPGNELMALRDVDDSAFGFTPYSGYASPAAFTFHDTSDGSTMTFPALGYRSGKSGQETVTANGAQMTELWTSHANKHEAVALVLTNDSPISHKMPDEARLEAFGIRPVAE